MHPFGKAVLAGDHEAALATIADDVTFRSRLLAAHLQLGGLAINALVLQFASVRPRV